MKTWRTAALLLTLGLAGGLGFIYSGLADPAADTPHSRPVLWLLERLRDHGIERRAHSIAVPDLSDPDLIRSGAGNYDAMCAACHLKPGLEDSEMYRGLYPQPPALARESAAVAPEHAFWTIKHGIKASAMAAWGRSMDDRAIWGLVAFLQRLPALSPDAYREAVEQSPGHSHGSASPVKPTDHEDDGAHHRTDGEQTEPAASASPTRKSSEDDHDTHRHAKAN